MTREALIFIDEFGNVAFSFEKKGTFSHFVYCAVTIDASDRQKAENLRLRIAKTNKLGDNIKSSNIGDRYFNRRLKVLKDLVEGLDFSIDLLVIDKRQLENHPGLRQREVFYKYFQSYFVKKYNDIYESFSIWADEVGEPFRFELEEYVRKKVVSPTLFHPDRFFFLADDITEEKLIQFADIMCGSLGKVFCASHVHERGQEIYDILHTRLSIEYYPYKSILSEIENYCHSHDQVICEINLENTVNYLEKTRNAGNDEESRLLEYLLMNFHVNPDRLIPTYELTIRMKYFFNDINDDKIRTIVRNLRYNGIFIISHHGKTGYKLASSHFDITKQYNHYLKYVIPMLKKIRILNNGIAKRTSNEINIIENESSFKELKQILSCLK